LRPIYGGQTKIGVKIFARSCRRDYQSENNMYQMRLEIFTAMVFWVMTLCRDVVVYQWFGGPENIKKNIILAVGLYGCEMLSCT
jgi:hypothetical protein